MATLGTMKVLKFYPYESVRISGERITFPRDVMRSFEEELAKLAGVNRPDNKTCYYVDLGNYEPPKYFMFHDFWMFMGDEIEDYHRREGIVW